MEALIILALLVIGTLVLALPVSAFVVAGKARRQSEELGRQFGILREQSARLKLRIELLEAADKQPRAVETPPPAVEAKFAPPVSPRDFVTANPVKPAAPRAVQNAVPHPVPPPRLEFTPPVESAPRPGINLEQFMGAKLFAWVGGLALFLGVIFFVKLSIERGWLSPELRTAIGFVIGAGLVCGGMIMHRRERYVTLAKTLCATGIVMIYGVTFAAHSIWRIPPLDLALVAFAMMTLITAAAFLLAVRLNAQVVAVLGMLGGFLTPVLCSTGRDNPFGLFSYIALLDIGVLAVVKNKRWLHLTVLAAAGTIFMQADWMIRFFRSSEYAIGSATWVPVGVFLGFAALFTFTAWRTKERDPDDLFPAGSALALCGSAMVTAFVFLAYRAITVRPLLLYTLVLGINAIALCVMWRQSRVRIAQGILGMLTFLHLSIWTLNKLRPELLPHALGIYLVFGVLHTALSVLMERKTPGQVPFAGWVPVFSLVLLLMPVLCLDAISFAIWPVILIVDLLIIGLAVVSGRLLTVLAALVLTLTTAAVWLFRWPQELVGAPMPFLIVVGGFAVLFGLAGSLLFRRLPNDQLAPLLPVSSAILPFLLLILATLQLKIGNPSPVFGLALLLTVFLLGLVRISSITVLAPTALGCVLALEWAWHLQSFSADHAGVPLLWYIGFYAIFTVFPFLFHKQFAARKLPWITSAAAGIGTFSLVYRLVGEAWPNEMMGLLPVAFTIVPLLSLVCILKLQTVENPARITQLAWFGGVALFFITLIFPIQFEKQWITLGWALEGAALCWLFRRVPHPGLRGTGTALLVASFVRLALNPAVLEYQIRGETPILNWQLYAYSTTALAMFFASAWLTPPAHLWGKVNLRGLLCSLGGILLFLLLNIEIADAFTPAGKRSIAFDFDGNLARDMTYTIAWALFALTLLVLGIWKRNPPMRYAGIGLLAVTLLKLFLHDLANIDSGYRIGALIGVAVIALAASYLYQRFLTDEKS